MKINSKPVRIISRLHLLLLLLSVSAFPQAIISNGTVQLGVRQEGNLNVTGGTPSSGTGTTVVGLRYIPNNAEAIAAGGLDEGWGVGDANSGLSGNAHGDTGVVNLRLVSFTSTATTATSIVDMFSPFNGTSILRVTHNYVPEPLSPFLYRINVTIQNLTSSNVRLRYRRVMDWDVEPTAFDEFVTVIQGSSPFLIATTNNGFDSTDPLAAPVPAADRPISGNFVDWPVGAPNPGTLDHGALFNFDFGNLAPGTSRSFVTFYGAAGSESEAEAARGTVAMEAYSLAQPGLREDVNGNGYPDGAEFGAPNTFLFGFGSIGPTAAHVSISGRVVTAQGRGVTKARVSINDTAGVAAYAVTNAFGYFRIGDIRVGETYILTVDHKRHQFAPQVVNVTEEITDLHFIAK